MKLLLLTLIVLEVCLVMIAISPVSPFVSLKSRAQAYDDWQKLPTTENEAAWLREKAAFNHKQLVENICVYGLLALNAVGLIFLFMRVQNQTPKS
ncbi:MAG: hypothetical protein HOP33_08440 [Verrucomicrobia bacterium]|nr:hypothetical protein [Verrucomicrobiota bacterium]